MRVGAGRADGWLARFRFGEAVLCGRGPEARDRALGADRVTCPRSLVGAERVTAPERVWGPARVAPLEGAGAPERAVPVARRDRSGVADGAGAFRRVTVLDLPLRDVEGRDVVAREGGVRRVGAPPRLAGPARARETASEGRTRVAEVPRAP